MTTTTSQPSHTAHVRVVELNACADHLLELSEQCSAGAAPTELSAALASISQTLKVMAVQTSSVPPISEQEMDDMLREIDDEADAKTSDAMDVVDIDDGKQTDGLDEWWRKLSAPQSRATYQEFYSRGNLTCAYSYLWRLNQHMGFNDFQGSAFAKEELLRCYFVGGNPHTDNVDSRWAPAFKVARLALGDKCWEMMYDKINSKPLVEVIATYKRWQPVIDVNGCSLAEYRSGTFVHSMVVDDNKVRAFKKLEFLLSIGCDVSIPHDHPPVASARAHGKWHVAEKLKFAKFSHRMRERCNQELFRVGRMKGINNQWHKAPGGDDDGKGAEEEDGNGNGVHLQQQQQALLVAEMAQALPTLLLQRCSISDDHLMLCWRLEMEKFADKPLECGLWQTLESVLRGVLKLPLNRRDWQWFKDHIFHSALWYERLPDGSVLYSKLVAIVVDQLAAQVEFLRGPTTALAGQAAWLELIAYPESIVCAASFAPGLRQDSVVDGVTGEQVLPFANLPVFSNAELDNLYVRDFDARHHFDVHGYLSQLILVAHMLNESFHATMRGIFGIDPETNVDQDLSVEYRGGPVKRIARCQAKAETDYAGRPYPTTAQILDFVRCTLIFETPAELLDGLHKLERVVESGTCCLRRICRLKNMFAENKRENGGQDQDDLYLCKYADIKLAVLMVDEQSKRCMLVEVQFLLRFMLHAKKMGHGLYEIVRDAEFVEDMAEVLALGADPKDAFMSAMSRGDAVDLGRLILAQPSLDLFNVDAQMSRSPLVFCITHGHTKCVELLLSCMSSDEQTSSVKLITTDMYKETPLLAACRCGAPASLVKTLLAIAGCDVNATNSRHGLTCLHHAVRENQMAIVKTLLDVDSINVNAMSWLNQTALHFAFEANNRAMVDLLLSRSDIEHHVADSYPLFLSAVESCSVSLTQYALQLWPDTDVNQSYKHGKNAMIIAVKNDAQPLVEFLMSFDAMDVNVRESYHGENAWLAAVAKNNLRIAQLLWGCKRRAEIDFNCRNGNGGKAYQIAEDYTMSRWLVAIGFDTNYEYGGGSISDKAVAAFLQPEKDEVEPTRWASATGVPCCRELHELQQYRVTTSKGRCDGCRARLFNKQWVHCCQKCQQHYFLCDDCFTSPK